jgi:hypothetical protein
MPYRILQSVAEKQQTGFSRPLAQRINEAITDAVISSEGVPALELAARVVDENPDLFREQIVSLTARLISVTRRKLSKPSIQLTFPEFEKRFTALPKRIALPTGKRVARACVTYRQFREFAKSLEARYNRDPLRVQVKAIIELMHPYARKTPGITYDEVKRLESEKHGWPE